MLSMKTLRVAIVTMGSALLLGPGMAAADTFNLDASGRSTDPITPPQAFASETLTLKDTIQRRDFYEVKNPITDGVGMRVAVRTARRVDSDESLFLRLELHGGAVFGAGEGFDDPGDTAITNVEPSMGGNEPPADDGTAGSDISELTVAFAARTSGGDGSRGQDYIVFKLGTPTDGLDIGTVIYVDVSHDISVPAGTGNYGASITAHTTADDAIDGLGTVSAFGGSGTVISVVNGLSVRLVPGRAVAEVDAGFLWFDNGPLPTDLKGQDKIGQVSVGPAQLPDMAMLHSANDGGVITVGRAEVVGDAQNNIDQMDAVPSTIGDYLVEANGVHVMVTGNLSVGAFSFIPDAFDAQGATTATCPGATASANNPDRGNLYDDDSMLLVSEDGEAAAANMGYSAEAGLAVGVQSLCVNVDIMGRATNETPIPSGLYNAVVSIQPPTVEDPDDFIEGASGVIGRITRNGTSVKIAYLTVSDKYNQRLIIANRGSTPALFEIGEFVTEEGTSVELSDAAEAAKEAGLNAIPPGGQMVIPVADMLSFSGVRNRAGATISVNSNPANIQVATTQVNLDDGSTDTVVYAADPDQSAGL